jgi:hypothetical protein
MATCEPNSTWDRGIEKGLATLSGHFGERALFVGPRRTQATPELFRWPQLITVHDPAFEPTFPVIPAFARQPYDITEPQPLLTDPLTRAIAEVFNLGYEVLLQTLNRFFTHTDETDEQLQALANAAFGLMGGVLRQLGRTLPRLPAGPDHPGLTAGPTFEMYSSRTCLSSFATCGYPVAPITMGDQRSRDRERPEPEDDHAVAGHMSRRHARTRSTISAMAEQQRLNHKPRTGTKHT